MPQPSPSPLRSTGSSLSSASHEMRTGPRLFDRHRSTQTDVEGRQPLLPIEHGRDALVVNFSKLRAMRRVSLMIVQYEVIELELTASGCFHFPEQEGAERISLHNTVEQSFDLFGLP